MLVVSIYTFVNMYYQFLIVSKIILLGHKDEENVDRKTVLQWEHNSYIIENDIWGW